MGWIRLGGHSIDWRVVAAGRCTASLSDRPLLLLLLLERWVRQLMLLWLDILLPKTHGVLVGLARGGQKESVDDESTWDSEAAAAI